MKKVLSVLLTLMLVATTLPMSIVFADEIVASESLVGAGTDASPYLIASAADLKKASELANTVDGASKVYQLTADIDYQNNVWTPIGKSENIVFSGKFLGNNHVVKNLKVKESYADYNHGFFGRTGQNSSNVNAQIRDLGIENITVEITTSAAARIGGFIGMADRVDIRNCYIANSTVREMTPTLFNLGVGVFVGRMQNSTIANCYAYNSTVAGSAAVGCFAGRPENSAGTLTNCYAAAITVDNTGVTNAKDPSKVARFMFKADTATVSNCYSDFAGSTADDFVETVSSKATIAKNIGPAFISDDSVNNGYPCFAWEIWNGETATAFAGGTGKEGDPYLISNAAQLKYFSEITNGNLENSKKHYKLTNDINYLGYEWTPAALNTEFTGSFDGNKHVIKNFKITQNHVLNGFFYDMAGTPSITDLGIENATIYITSDDGKQAYLYGVFAGRTAGTIKNCYVKNSSIAHYTQRVELGMGAFTGGVRHASDVFENCYVYNVDMYSNKKAPSGFYTYKDAEGQTFKNCYVAEVRTNNASYYGFAPEYDIKVTNCYTTLADTGVTATTKVAYAADKEAIKYALVAFDADCDYKVNSKINNGYPALSYQKAAAYDNKYEVTMLSTADGIKARIETNEAVDGATVYVATYDNDGRLIAAEALDADTIVTSTLSADGAKTIKVFVWDANCNKLATAFVK